MGPKAGLSQGQAEPWLTSHWSLLKLMDTVLGWFPHSLQATHAEGVTVPISQMRKLRLRKVR